MVGGVLVLVALLSQAFNFSFVHLKKSRAYVSFLFLVVVQLFFLFNFSFIRSRSKILSFLKRKESIQRKELLGIISENIFITKRPFRGLLVIHIVLDIINSSNIVLFRN